MQSLVAKVETHQCKYCQKSFKRESTLASHLCEQKRRFQEKNEVGVQIGYQAYLRFFEYTQGSTKKKAWEDFAKSPYYKAFVKFGRYCVDVRAINVSRFTEFVIKNNKKLDYWATDSTYSEYLEYLLRNESHYDALERAIENSIEWAKKNDADAKDIIRYGNANATCYLITTGQLSPWVVYNSDSGHKFLSTLNSDQQAIVWPFIDPEFWQKKFAKHSEERKYVDTILKQAGW